MTHTRFHDLTLTAACVTLLACAGRDDTPSPDTASASLTNRTDSGTVALTNTRAPARDAEQEFLRMMSDHHEGLIQMATTAMSKAIAPATQSDARRVHTKQLEEQKQMIAMLQDSYDETLTPTTTPSNKPMIDSLEAKSGAEYDRAFYASMVAHHREAIRMVDDMLPRLTRADLRQMAEKMKSDQQREITEFQQKPR